MNDIFYKEINLMEMRCNHAILGNEISYYTEASSSFKEKIGKILEAIKSFFTKLKNKVQEKIRSAKIKKDVKRLNAIIANKKSNNIMIDIDTTKNLVEVRMSVFLRDAQKAANLKDPEKVKAAFNKVYEAACKDIDLYISASKGGKLHKKFIKRVKLRQAAKMALQELKGVNSDLDKVYKELATTVKKTTSIRSMFKESVEFDEDVAYMEAKEEANSDVGVTIATKTNSLGSKVGSFLAKHPFIITAAVFAGGVAVGAKAGYDSGLVVGNLEGWGKGYSYGYDEGKALGRETRSDV